MCNFLTYFTLNNIFLNTINKKKKNIISSTLLKLNSLTSIMTIYYVQNYRKIDLINFITKENKTVVHKY